MCAFLLLYGGAENAFGSWAAIYAEQEYFNDDVTEAETLDSVFWIAITIGRLISAPLATRLSARTMIGIDLTGCLIFSLLLAQIRSVGLLWAGSALLGFFMASLYGAAFTVPAELKVKLTGKSASAFIIAAGIGDVALPSFMAVLIRVFNSNNALIWGIAGLLITCIGIYVFVYSFGLATMEKKLDDTELEELSELDEHWEFENT